MAKALRYLTFSLAIVGLSCAQGEPEELSAAQIRVSIDKSDPERLLRYYLGGYVSPEPADPFDAGIVEKRGRRLYVNIDSLEHNFPGAVGHFVDTNNTDRIEWEEFEQFLDATYYRARAARRTLDSLHRDVAFDSAGTDWMMVELDGAMTTARRHIYIRIPELAEALRGYWENEEQIIYPVGTTIFGEHRLDGSRRETTVMRKREDGLWDFFVYGANDSLAQATSTPPKELKSPVQCVGCHFGNKLFEPEKSFPVAAQPGPDGPRRLYVSDSLRSERLVRFFDEHRKRSDTILGLYGTLFVAKLQSMQRAGTITEEYASLLETLAL